jgi:hypothetical protein
VNQLYMNSAFGPGGDESSAAELKALDEKRKVSGQKNSGLGMN